MPDRIRSFVAVEISDPQTMSKLEEMQNLLIATGADLKIVPKENLHFTLRFLGEITEGRVQNICAELKTLSFAPFVAHIKGAGAFPRTSRINVIWAGLSEGEGEFRKIFDSVESKLAKVQFSRDPKGFSPHITVARVRTGRNKVKLVQVVTELAEFDVGQFAVKRISLKKSVLTPAGPIYSTICEATAS